MPNLPHEIHKVQHHSVIFRVHKHAGITEWYLKWKEKKYRSIKRDGRWMQRLPLTFLVIKICYFEID